jgi:hypothetical protein
MADMVNIMNTIREHGSTEYQNFVPVAVRDDISAVSDPILTYQTVANEFLTTLFNRIGLAIIHHKTYKNPLGVLKKGGVPLGSDVQEILNNLGTGDEYDPTGSKIFAVNKPDVKTIYHRMDRRQTYPVTIYEEQLRVALTSWEKLEELLNTFVTTLYSADNRDEFILMKNLFATAVTSGKIVTAETPVVTDETTGKQFVKAVRNLSTYFTYPSTQFNKYFDFKPASDTGKAVETWCEKKDQILILRSDVATEIDVEVLAQAFNLNKTDLMGNILEIDTFGAATNCKGILADKSWVQVYDNMEKLTSQYNGHGLFWNYWLHHWQTYSLSMFADAVALVDPAIG